MKFHGILIVNNESDIIGQCLESLLTWCDNIYVYDTGSVDETWEIVQSYAHQNSQILPFKKETVMFHDGIRSYIFSQFRDRAESGDWFIRLDADEFYDVISPPEFVQTRLQRDETCVYNQTYEFRFTEQEFAEWKLGRETISDRNHPIQERRRFFIPLYYGEPRMFRYRPTMQWLPSGSFPYNAGLVAKERIPICHYPHRDPLQMRVRCIVRSVMAKDTTAVGRHWLVDDWRELMINKNTDGLLYWQHNTSLPEYHFSNHIASMPKRVLQQLVHNRVILPIIDYVRPVFPSNYQPQPISALNKRRIEENVCLGFDP